MEKMDEQEIWKDIPGYEGLYQASSLGNIRRNKRGKWALLHTNDYPDIYKNKTLCKDGVKTSIKVHRLVAMTFLPNPENKEYVNHRDFDKGNNRLENLEWVTQSENMIHFQKELKARRERLWERYQNEALSK